MPSNQPVIYTNIQNLGQTLQNVYDELSHLDEQLHLIYEKYPGLFTKPPKEMSITDKVKFASAWLKMQAEKGRA